MAAAYNREQGVASFEGQLLILPCSRTENDASACARRQA
jgi:hypothetical protein